VAGVCRESVCGLPGSRVAARGPTALDFPRGRSRSRSVKKLTDRDINDGRWSLVCSRLDVDTLVFSSKVHYSKATWRNVHNMLKSKMLSLAQQSTFRCQTRALRGTPGAGSDARGPAGARRGQDVGWTRAHVV